MWSNQVLPTFLVPYFLCGAKLLNRGGNALLLFTICLSFLTHNAANGQRPAHAGDSTTTGFAERPRVEDSLLVGNLPALLQADSLPADTARPTRRTYSLSADAFEGEVKYSMRDSMHYSVRDQIIYLYGEARVEYQDLVLSAGYMEIDYANNLLVAQPISDTSGRLSELPNFVQGPQKFEARGMRYNFKTRKGIITNATTQQGDLYVLGGKTKFVAADPTQPDRTDNTVYNSDAIITTCDLDVPHYGIRSNKQKVVQDKQVIVGPSNVELAGVPTPLWLPFGFFPVGTSERSGLIFPTDYTFTDIDGFGFQQVGWYFPWNEYVHSSVTFDVFLKGTARFNTVNNYSRRYRYSGNVALGASRNRLASDIGENNFTQAVSLAWTHSQDPKANPYRSFRANVNIQTNNYASRNGQSLGSQITNQFRSNLAGTFKFPEHPSWNLTVGASHSQNTQTRQMRITAPETRFSTGAIYPFANLGTKSNAWYKKAIVNYDAQFRGEVETTDTTLFDRTTWQNALLGGQHRATFSAPINFLRYFRLSPNASFTQTVYFDEFERVFLSEERQDINFTIVGEDTIAIDTITVFDGRVVDTLTQGISVANAVTAAMSLSTNIYGTARFKLGSLRGIRHIITPSLNIGYTPDYSEPPFNYYKEVQVNDFGDRQSYLAFPNRPFNPGSLPDRLALRVGYSIGNRFESKIQSRSDSTSRIVSLVNNLTFAGSYNLAADSLKWSRITVSGARLALFKKVVQLSASGGQFDLYERGADGRRVDTLLASKGKFPVRFDRLRLDLTAGLTLRQLRGFITGEERAASKDEIYSLIDAFRLSFNYSRAYDRFRRNGDRPWQTTASTVNVRGSIPISSKWSIRQLTIGYDFRNRQLSYPSLGIGRDLHCWEMDLYWYPRFSAFTFGIRVKPSSLGFLELPYRRGNRI